jgi:hypothetical protein
MNNGINNIENKNKFSTINSGGIGVPFVINN